ncbi:MAG: RNB domain-containing ribonuclease [Acidobacteria bacterium]|nr:MAG: RNB domain-containing ribonuclease [Acidobacteriota bacterium]
MVDYQGRIIEYLGAGGVRFALVVRHAGEKLQIIDERGRHDRISAHQVITVHAAKPDPAEFPEVVQQLRARIQPIQEEVDTELLWETVRDDLREYRIEELVEHYFANRDPVRVSALFRALLKDALHFKRKGLIFIPRSEQHVSEQLLAIRRRREKQALRQQALDWMRGVLQADDIVEVPADMVSLIHQVEDYLLRRKSNEVVHLLNEVSEESTAKEVAFELLLKTGRLDPDADPLLVIAGIEERFPRRVLERAEHLAPFRPEPGRRDFSSLLSFSIDDEETREIDDALTVRVHGDRLIVGVHIADVAHFVTKGDPLDEEAHRRGASIYMPTRTVSMFPPRLAYELASLNQGDWRPTMSFEIAFDATGRVVDWQLSRGQIVVTRRLSYAEADRLLRSPADDEVAEPVRRLHEIAQQLLAERLKQGAIVIRRPELKVRVRDGRIAMKVIDPRSPSRQLVGEFMILANRLAAQHAARQGVPIIFRTQDPPRHESEFAGHIIEYDPIRMSRVLKGMKRSRLSLSPQPHAGLGLDVYTQLTSPIRRFADVIIQRQLVAYLADQPLPYQPEELLRVLATAESTEREMRAIERQSTRFWVLRYLADERRQETFEAIVIESSDGGYVVELTDFFLRGHLSTGIKHEWGERVRVRIEHIDPQRDVLRFAEVGPEC